MRIRQADEIALHDERCLRRTAILFKVPEVRARLSIPNWHHRHRRRREVFLADRTCRLLSTQLF
jgi:hypothetical protein